MGMMMAKNCGKHFYEAKKNLQEKQKTQLIQMNHPSFFDLNQTCQSLIQNQIKYSLNSNMSWMYSTIITLTFMASALCSKYASDFFLSDQALFDKAQRGIGLCSISGSCNTCFCPNYAKVQFNGRVQGLPDRYGSGCLERGCWGPPNTYHLYSNTLLSVCTGNKIKDGANMIRIGIVKGYCDQPAPRRSGYLRSSNSNQTSNTTAQQSLNSAQESNLDAFTLSSAAEPSPIQNNFMESASKSPKRNGLELREALFLAGFILSGVLNVVLGVQMYRKRQKGEAKEVEAEKQVSDPQKQADSSNKFQINK